MGKDIWDWYRRKLNLCILWTFQSPEYFVCEVSLNQVNLVLNTKANIFQPCRKATVK